MTRSTSVATIRPLVFDPPSYIYQPPPFVAMLPPEVSYTTHSLELGGITLNVDLFQFLAHGLDPEFFVEEFVSRFVSMSLATTAFFRLESVAYGSLSWRYVPDFFWPWLYDETVEITIESFQITYSTGELQQVTRVVTPPPVVVDPPAYVFKRPRTFDISRIRGRLTIQGGDQYETQGDTVIVHNQDGSSAAGVFTNRITPRMIQTGEDQRGDFIFVQDEDETGALWDTFQTVEGIGLPRGTGLDTNAYFGVRMDGIEDVDLRLASGNDSFTVAEGEYRQYANFVDSVTHGTVLQGLSLRIVAGPGDDTIRVKQIGAFTEVLGGAGSDKVYVDDAGYLSAIEDRLVFDGDATIEEEIIPVRTAEYADILAVGVPEVFINSAPHSGLAYEDPEGNIVFYELAERAPILADDGSGNLLVWVVVQASNGSIIEDLIHEQGVQERGIHQRGIQKTVNGVPVFLDENGYETTTDTGVPVIVFDAGGSLLYFDEYGNMTFTLSDRKVITTNPTGALVYLDEDDYKTFAVTEKKSFVTDFEAGRYLYIDSLTSTKIDPVPASLVVDGPRADFNVYEVDSGEAEFQYLDVLVSQDGIHFFSVKASEGAVVRVAGDGFYHTNDTYARSYDLAGTGLSYATHIRIVGSYSGNGPSRIRPGRGGHHSSGKRRARLPRGHRQEHHGSGQHPGPGCSRRSVHWYG